MHFSLPLWSAPSQSVIFTVSVFEVHAQMAIKRFKRSERDQLSAGTDGAGAAAVAPSESERRAEACKEAVWWWDGGCLSD
jgi:hypothetical protein